MTVTGKNIFVEMDADGVFVVTLDVPQGPLNPLSDEFVHELDAALDLVASRDDVRGVLVTSGKSAAFAAGWNLKTLLGQLESTPDAASLYAATGGLSRVLRKLETCGRPVAAAINGLALGGGLELALACHHRVLADHDTAKVGLPEVKVGLLPGAGGTQRLPRLIGVEAAVKMMVDGEPVVPTEALRLGIVHELAPVGEVVARARAWLLSTPTATQPWDRKDVRPVGGAQIPLRGDLTQFFMGAVPEATRRTLRNYPAPVAILSCVYEGLQLPLDRGLDIEHQQFALLASKPEAQNLIRTMFINKGKADKLGRRPAGIDRKPVTKVAVLGAGMMGAGLAHVLARAGCYVTVLDRTLELAQRALGHAERQLQKSQAAGKLDAVTAAEILARVKPTADYADMAGSEFVIEAVFENRAVKAEAIARSESVIDRDAVFATNTSTLPITGLADASSRPHRFIGMHFFSPVERMPLVEIIRSRTTDETTLAWTMDLARRLGKTPIVVNDSRGFFTSRVFGTYCYEGQMLLKEGVHPALIENAGRFAGMPVGPLAVMDEVSLELQYDVVRQSREDLGAHFVYPVSWDVLRRFVEDLKRTGRKAGAGFYDYPESGRKHLWPGLATEYPVAKEQPSLEEVKQRLLSIQSLETARCLQEGVLTNPVDGDLGSVFGWGYPSYTGGALSYIDMVGVGRFVETCKRFATVTGPRYEPCELLLDMAKKGARFRDAR